MHTQKPSCCDLWLEIDHDDRRGGGRRGTILQRSLKRGSVLFLDPYWIPMSNPCHRRTATEDGHNDDRDDRVIWFIDEGCCQYLFRVSGRWTGSGGEFLL